MRHVQFDAQRNHFMFDKNAEILEPGDLRMPEWLDTVLATAALTLFGACAFLGGLLWAHWYVGLS